MFPLPYDGYAIVTLVSLLCDNHGSEKILRRNLSNCCVLVERTAAVVSRPP